MKTLSAYGLFRSHPWALVRARGLLWLRWGYCPCCYSSPPLHDCPICSGYDNYGTRLSDYHRDLWRNAWLARCRRWR